jgi:hypothetical protein
MRTWDTGRTGTSPLLWGAPVRAFGWDRHAVATAPLPAAAPTAPLPPLATCPACGADWWRPTREAAGPHMSGPRQCRSCLAWVRPEVEAAD